MYLRPLGRQTVKIALLQIGMAAIGGSALADVSYDKGLCRTAPEGWEYCLIAHYDFVCCAIDNVTGTCTQTQYTNCTS